MLKGTLSGVDFPGRILLAPLFKFTYVSDARKTLFLFFFTLAWHILIGDMGIALPYDWDFRWELRRSLGFGKVRRSKIQRSDLCSHPLGCLEVPGISRTASNVVPPVASPILPFQIYFSPQAKSTTVYQQVAYK